jgi:hypothetical protein
MTQSLRAGDSAVFDDDPLSRQQSAHSQQAAGTWDHDLHYGKLYCIMTIIIIVDARRGGTQKQDKKATIRYRRGGTSNGRARASHNRAAVKEGDCVSQRLRSSKTGTAETHRDDGDHDAWRTYFLLCLAVSPRL